MNIWISFELFGWPKYNQTEVFRLPSSLMPREIYADTNQTRGVISQLEVYANDKRGSTDRHTCDVSAMRYEVPLPNHDVRGELLWRKK
tara:strand:- start:238 stop:501 length:264 start_codon:yes stop_codon:yes gene_type:complete